jgi:hypothetical protein
MVHGGGMEKTEATTTFRQGQKRRSRAEWAKDIGEWQKSGGTAKAYATARGLNPGTFAWWIRQLQADSSTRANGTSEKPTSKEGIPGFLPLRAVSEKAQHRRIERALTIEVDLANGRRVHLQVQGNEDLSKIAAVVDALEGRA